MKKTFKDIFWYLEKVGGSEVFNFDNHTDAYNFGHSIREKEGDNIEVEIGVTFVRVKLIEQEACIPRKSRV